MSIGCCWWVLVLVALLAEITIGNIDGMTMVDLLEILEIPGNIMTPETHETIEVDVILRTIPRLLPLRMNTQQPLVVLGHVTTITVLITAIDWKSMTI